MIISLLRCKIFNKNIKLRLKYALLNHKVLYLYWQKFDTCREFMIHRNGIKYNLCRKLL